MKKILINFLFLLLFPLFAFSQEKLSLTITPPLIKVSLSPGQVWQSSVKIVNNNPKDLNLFVTVMDFKSGPEGGIVFIKEKEKEDKRFLLSEWIDFPKDQISIPAFQSQSVPFTIRVPENAEAGGKYAAILVGAKGPEEIGGTAIKITPLVSSLILANVRGEVKEALWIREFSTDKIFYQKPKVEFNLKIENIGNVHVQPQGEIKILNIFGKERGIIPFNQKTEYGNILPQSSRKWSFTWEGEDSLLEVGRYRAILTLIYGEETKQTENREVSFWILPLVPLIAISISIFIFFILIFLIVRIYVKRAISLSLKEVKKEMGIEKERVKIKIPIISAIKERKISDIKPGTKKEIEETKFKERPKVSMFFRKKFLFPSLFLLLFAILIFSIYLNDFLKEKKEYKIETKTEKEQISPEKLVEKVIEEGKMEEEMEKEIKKEEIDKKSFSVSVLNGSGIKGLANEVAQNLEKEGFKIEKVGNAERFDYQKTLIFYKKGKEKEANFLNEFFSKKFELKEIENQKEDIILIIGKNFSQ